MTFTIDHFAAARLTAKLAEYPRVRLLDGPTPIHRLDHVGADMGINLWLKRDDLTPLMLGGDKPRKLEFEMAQALEAGADVIVTSGASQSNQARLTVAAARRLGLDAIVVLSRDAYTAFQGNLLLVHLMGAEVVLVDGVEHWDTEEDALALCDRLRAEARAPHYIPTSGTTPHSCLGYVAGGLELATQLAERDVEPDVFYLPFGTGGIFAAAMLTMRSLGVPTRFVGISVAHDVARIHESLDHWWAEVATLVEIDPDRGTFALYDDFVGNGYGDPTPEALDAIASLATREGILLDPVYSGKVFAGLRKHRATGMISDGATVVMLHSGGMPATFAYHADVAAHLGIAEAP